MTATDTTPRYIVDQPGIYDGMTDDTYHGDPVPGGSLSSGGARKLLPPSCPARFHYDRAHGRAPRQEFDFGHAAHQMVLGFGPEIVPVDANDWKTKAAQAARDDARSAGKVPLLAREVAEVQAMAAALREHPLARTLLDPDRGDPEQSAFWFDSEFEIWRRARYDWLPHATGSRLLVIDYKTTVSANPDSIRKSVANFGYQQQADWYLAGLEALGVSDDAAFLFLFQEKTAPYLVTVAELDAVALRDGRDRNRRAMEVYAECSATDMWPAYSDDIELIGLPPWARLDA